jgi:hypothetical protein
VAPLKKAGKLVNNGKKKAQILVDQFKSVFIKDERNLNQNGQPHPSTSTRKPISRNHHIRRPEMEYAYKQENQEFKANPTLGFLRRNLKNALNLVVKQHFCLWYALPWKSSIVWDPYLQRDVDKLNTQMLQDLKLPSIREGKPTD